MRLVLSTLLVLLLTGGSALAADRFVAPKPKGNDQGGGNACLSVPTPCLTLANALAHANSGDVIKIAKGTYKANVGITTAGTWTIKGGYDPKTFLEATRDVERKKTTFTGGTGGVFLTINAFSGQSIQIILDGLAIARSVGKAPEYGGGVSAAAAFGGAIDLTVDRVTMTGNRASFGGGLSIAAFDDGTLTTHITHSLFQGNHADGGGGAIHGGAGGTGTTTLVVEDTTFVSNSADFQGGAVDGFSVAAPGGFTAMTFRRAIFDKNKAGPQSPGGAMDMFAFDGAGGGQAASLFLTVENSIIQGNRAGAFGNAVNLEAFINSGANTATITANLMNNTIVANNTNQSSGSTLNIFPVSFQGPGSSATVTATLQNNIVYANDGIDVALFVQDPESHASLDLKTNNIGVLAQGFGTTVVADPDPQLSVDPQLVKKQGVYRLKATSPMIAAGTCDGAPADDFEGDPRPTGTGLCGVDIGADQFIP